MLDTPIIKLLYEKPNISIWENRLIDCVSKIYKSFERSFNHILYTMIISCMKNLMIFYNNYLKSHILILI